MIYMAEVKLVGGRYIVWTSEDGSHMYREATVEEVIKALKLGKEKEGAEAPETGHRVRPESEGGV